MFSHTIVAVLAIACCARAFVPATGPAAVRQLVVTRSGTDHQQADQKFTHEDKSEGRINSRIQMDSPKVADSMELGAGEKKVLCRCWKSETFPICNGAHTSHNQLTGDNVGPISVSVKK